MSIESFLLFLAVLISAAVAWWLRGQFK